ncbi:MAG TPA: 1-deoxy-D-xylulose-5-phosphate synthase [Anaeromyxobacter sp.]|nr:1-deoxy-D-xylulose-5-phosphate synthase [Anaeromyxobacter sp.]
MTRLLSRIDSPEDLKVLALDELPALCQELRTEIVRTCARNGGHLGSSLGALELNVALHYVFETPHDKLVWDVGHQAYAHKLLTGRRDAFSTIRTPGGLAGFPERAESPHDAFGVGHASTAISAALGMLEAQRLTGAQGKVVAVVGDGAMTGGMAFEGLNQAGYLGRNLLVVLNDNEMSISPNVGALSEWLSKKFASRTYDRWRRSVKEFLANVPRGPQAIEVIRHGINATKALVTPGILFEGLGFHYVGPVDGHDVLKLVETFQKLASFDGPVLLHAVTTKGKGYQPAESDKATGGHGLSFFDVDTGKPVKKSTPAARSYTEHFAQALCEEMEREPRIVAITAAMLEGTGLIQAKQRFPERTYDVGIAEQHAVTFAAGLACEGVRPVVAIYSTFLQRAYDQIIHDVALQNLPVTFALDRGGLVGADGKTHQGAFDLAYLRCVPNLTVLAPADENELRHGLHTALQLPGPAAIRFPRGAGEGVALEPVRALEVGRGRIVRNVPGKPDACVIAVGPTLRAALAAAERLAADGLAVTVIDPRFVKPLDAELLCAEAARAGRVVTVEEGCLAGGVGSACLELFASRGLVLPVRCLGLPDAFVTHGDPAAQRADLGLDADGIAAACRALVGKRAARGAA